MSPGANFRLPADPRWFQIAGQAAILAALVSFRNFGSPSLHIAAGASACVFLEWVGARLTSGRFDWKSPFITSLSLALLLRANDVWPIIFAAVLGVGAKFVLRFGDRHVFNPANLGIVGALLLGDVAWTSTGEWGSAPWMALMIALLGGLTTWRAGRLDTPFVYLFVYGALIFARAIYLGDPLSIPELRLTNGALVLFAFFTISDPRTTPDRLGERIAVVSAAAALAYILQYHFWISDGVFYAPTMIGLLRYVAYRLKRPARLRAARRTVGAMAPAE
jgi:Na+-transporting NADH:ubiquinone oxidoreductase subunit NqrB